MLDPHEYTNVLQDPMDLDPSQYVIVRYRVEPGEGLDIEKTAALIAINGSLGTPLPLPYEERGTRLKSFSARVLFPLDSENTVSVAYPLDMCSPQDGLAQLLAVIWFTGDYNYTKAYWVDSIQFPQAYVKHFDGPRYGVDGIRRVMGVANRPLLGVIVKPRRGVPWDVILNKCYEGLIGGADYIVDDELMTSADLESLRLRIEAMVRMTKRAEQQTRQKKSYVAYISGSPVRAMWQAQVAINAGASALLLNAFTMGFAGFEDFTRNPTSTVPVLTCNMGAGILTRPSPHTGVSETVVSLLSRLAGADGVYSGISGALWYSPDALRGSFNALRSGFWGKRQTMAVVAGGLNIVNMWPNIALMGSEIMLQAGSSILGYSRGPREMAYAMRLILDNMPHTLSDEQAEKRLLQLADEHAELARALQFYNYQPRNRK